MVVPTWSMCVDDQIVWVSILGSDLVMIAPTYFRSMWGSSPEVWPCPSVPYAEAVLHGSVLDGLPWMVVVMFGWAAFGHRVQTHD